MVFRGIVNSVLWMSNVRLFSYQEENLSLKPKLLTKILYLIIAIYIYCRPYRYLYLNIQLGLFCVIYYLCNYSDIFFKLMFYLIIIFPDWYFSNWWKNAQADSSFTQFSHNWKNSVRMISFPINMIELKVMKCIIFAFIIYFYIFLYLNFKTVFTGMRNYIKPTRY